MSFAVIVQNNSLSKSVIIDDVPTPVTIQPQRSATLAGVAIADVRNSLLLRHYELLGLIEVLINGRAVKLSRLGLLVG